MTTTVITPVSITAEPGGVGRVERVLREVGRFVIAYAIALGVFAVIVIAKGANPVSALADMLRSTLDARSLGEVLVRTAPYLLAALAVAVPARAGLVNVGGEGQIVIGCVGAAGAARVLDGNTNGLVVIVGMGLAAAVCGAAWSGIAAGLRVGLRIPEAITTLLLNYIAIDVMLYLIYEPWKDPSGTGQPTSRPLSASAQLGTFAIGDGRAHAGIALAVVAAVAIWIIMRKTAWGFTLRVVGGNGDAAQRAGLPVSRLLWSAMLVGGAMAGLAGMVHFAGSEFKLRTGMTAGFGYTAFLASWLGRHDPLKVVGASLLLAFLAVGGSSLQLDSGLPAATVNVLMALVLLSVLATGAASARRKEG
jgi:general nucleoside transport system permease protein